VSRQTPDKQTTVFVVL